MNSQRVMFREAVLEGYLEEIKNCASEINEIAGNNEVDINEITGNDEIELMVSGIITSVRALRKYVLSCMG